MGWQLLSWQDEGDHEGAADEGKDDSKDGADARHVRLHGAGQHVRGQDIAQLARARAYDVGGTYCRCREGSVAISPLANAAWPAEVLKAVWKPAVVVGRSAKP